MRNLISIFILAILVCSCAKKNEVTIIAEFQKPKTHLTPELKKEINERIRTAGFELTHLESLPQNRFKTKLLLKRFNKARFAQAKSIFNVADLEFWDTYEVGKPPLENVAEILPKLEGFTPNINNNLPKVVLGLVDDDRNAASVFEQLQSALDTKGDLKLYQSGKHAELMGNEKRFQIYPINTKGKSKAVLTSKNVKEAKAAADATGLVVDFTFDEEGAKIWAEMTTKAAENSNQAVALVLNGKVVSAPTVRSAILGGACQISGNFDIEEATLIANTLNLGSFSEEVKIIEISEVEVN